MLVVMVRIPIGSEVEGARIEERFRNRAGLVDNEPGFRGFELLRGDGEYISMTRWESRGDLNRWMQSQGNAQAHGRPPTGGGHPQGGSHPHEHAEQQSDGANAPATGGPMSGSVLIYEVTIPDGPSA